MKKTIMILICLPALIFAQNFNGRLSSSIYSFQRFEDVNTSHNYLRTFQTAQLNLNQGKFALRTRFNLEADVAQKLVQDPRLRFYNLFLEARNIWDVLTIKLGRQSNFTGPITGVYDGLNLKLKYKNFKLVTYYGGNVPSYQKLELTEDFGKDYVAGGRLDYSPVANSMISLGYVRKNLIRENYYATRLDENYDPVKVLIQNKSNKFSYVYAKAHYAMADNFETHFSYQYDLNLFTTSRFEFVGRYDKIEDLGLSLYYNYRSPRVRYNSIFAVFDYANTYEIEGGVDYEINEEFAVFGKFGNVTYKDDQAQRISVGVNSNYGSLSYRKTLGYAGELDAVSAYTSKSFFDGVLTPSVGLSYTTYKLSPDAEKNNLISVLLGTNYRPWRNLSFDLQGQFFSNKIYNNDYRVFFRVNHWFNTNF